MNWQYLLNLVLLAQTCYLLGVSGMVMGHYYRTSYRTQPRLFKHIIAVSLSYIVFQARGIWAIYVGLIPLNDPWLYTLLAAGALGDYALLKVAQRQFRPLNGHRPGGRG